MSRQLYQDHFIDLARRRLGRAEADRLLRDTSRGDVASLRMLSDLLDVRFVRHGRPDGSAEVQVYERRERPCWHGATLWLDRHIPTSAQGRMPGMRLGDVIDGTYAEDATIASVGDDAGGTHVTVETGWTDATTIDTTIADRITGPARRAVRTIRLLLRAAERHQDQHGR